MYKHIMSPVDLAHVEKSEHALAVVTDQAKHYDATITYVAITSSAPNATAHNPADFSKNQEAHHGHRAATYLPNMADMLFPSHCGTLARHTDASVFLVRGR